MSTVPHGKESETVVRDTIRDGLRSAATDGAYLLDDPHDDGSGRSDGSEFVLTSFPSRDVRYPHVVVKEVADEGERRDSRVDLWIHNYSVRVECYGRSATEAMNLRAGVKEWIAKNVDTLRSAGFVDVSMSTTGLNHDADPQVNGEQITATGDLYTS